jgi:hypothetical protein
VRPETFKLLEENIGETLEDLGISDKFLNRTPTAQEMVARIDKWDCLRLKSFYVERKQQNVETAYRKRKKKSLPAVHSVGDQSPEYIKNSKN